MSAPGASTPFPDPIDPKGLACVSESINYLNTHRKFRGYCVDPVPNIWSANEDVRPKKHK